MSVLKDLIENAKSRGKRMLIAEIRDVPTIHSTETLRESPKIVGEIIATIVRGVVDASAGKISEDDALKSFMMGVSMKATDALKKFKVVDIQNADRATQAAASMSVVKGGRTGDN